MRPYNRKHIYELSNFKEACDSTKLVCESVRLEKCKPLSDHWEKFYQLQKWCIVSVPASIRTMHKSTGRYRIHKLFLLCLERSYGLEQVRNYSTAPFWQNRFVKVLVKRVLSDNVLSQQVSQTSKQLLLPKAALSIGVWLDASPLSSLSTNWTGSGRTFRKGENVNRVDHEDMFGVGDVIIVLWKVERVIAWLSETVVEMEPSQRK